MTEHGHRLAGGPADGRRPSAEELQGWRRYRTLWRLYRREQTEPELFYSTLAELTAADLDRRYGLDGARVLDLGSGPGWYSCAMARRGADAVSVEFDLDELSGSTRPAGSPRQARQPVVGDAGRVPLRRGAFDGVFCSNMLEHTSDAGAVIDEIARLLRPGGWGYVSFTNWYSPHGGHEMTPFQYLGPRLGPRLYEKLNGPPRKNRYGERLFAVHIGSAIRLVRSNPLLDVTRFEPRYWPWARAVMAVPGVREVLAWNCVIGVRRNSRPVSR